MMGLSFSVQAEFIKKYNVVVDTDTFLTWQDNASFTSIKKNYSEARAYCQELSLAGFSDWVLPTVKELLTITDKNKVNPSINSIFSFKNTGYFWSSSEDASDSNHASYVDFKFGNSYHHNKWNKNVGVRCVRRGELKTLTLIK